jgi:HEAT repeat protein
MTEVTPLSPELSRSVLALARALVAAARSWALYPPDHPAVRMSVERLRTALAGATAGQVVSFGVTPETLLIGGSPAGADGPVSEAAAWLHQHDILALTFAGDVPVQSLQALLALMAEGIDAVRARGGPAKAWLDQGHAAIAIEQIDFTSVFQDRDVQHPARRKDDLWRSIVRAVTDRRKVLDEAVQQRMLEIAGDVGAIGELAFDVIAPNYTADGSPMLTSQAAAVFAAYRHLVSIVDVMDPARRTEVMQNLTAATATLDPRVILQMLGGPEEAGAGAAGGTSSADIKSGIAAGFDDFKVAQLLATTLAIDGQATGRLAGVFDTIAPDEPRKRRVLTMTRTLLSETSFGQTNQFQTLWTSMEELLLAYNEKPFVSAQYKLGLDQIGVRADAMAGDIPEELVALIETLGQDNVRRLSVVLLVDLLKLEQNAERAPELARDVAALGEDLLLAGDYASALIVTRALAEQVRTPGAVASGGSRVALDGLVGTSAFHESVELLEEMTPEDAACFADICSAVGPAATDSLRQLIEVEELTPARQRAGAIIVRYGAPAATRLAPLVGSDQWYTRRNVAELLGDLRVPESVPLLQPLLRGSDARVMRAAVRALANIDDPAAARAVHTVLRAAAGAQRQAVVAALVAERDPRVVPLLVCILNESEPFGSDHQIVLEALGAIGELGRDEAVPDVAKVMRRRSWFARRKTRALKQGSITALQRIGSAAATQAIADAAGQGDRLLRKLAREAAGQPLRAND